MRSAKTSATLASVVVSMLEVLRAISNSVRARRIIWRATLKFVAKRDRLQLHQVEIIDIPLEVRVGI